MKQTFGILLCCSFLLGCGSPEEGALTVGTNTSRTNLLNTQTTSCYSVILAPAPKPVNDIDSRYFEIKAPILTWKSAVTRGRIYNIRFEFTGGPLGDFSKDVAGDELRALFGNVDPAKDNIIGPSAADGSGNPVPLSFPLFCSIKVGGIKLTDAQDTSFDMSVTVTFEGIEMPPEGVSGEESEFSTVTYLTVHNRGR